MKKRIIRYAGTATLSILAPAVMAGTWTVNNTVDDLPPSFPTVGSLRWAIDQANLDPNNPVVIAFNVTSGLTPAGVAVIQPKSPLPIINNVHGLGIMINGYTQPGSSYTPFNPSSLVIKVELDGGLITPTGSAPPYSHGLHIMSSNNTVQGLCVHSFPHDGISIEGIPANTNGHPGSNTNYIQWNMVGTDVTGMTALPNGHDGAWPGGGGLWGGIYIRVVPAPPGVSLPPRFANDNVVLENVASGNAIEGVGIANCPDVGCEVKRNHVERCYVGVDITGFAPLGNGHTGIYLGEGAEDNVIEQNWVCGNGFSGVSIVGLVDPPIFTDGNEVSRNKIGVDVGLNPMGNALHGVAIGSYGDPSVSQSYVGGHARTNKVLNNIIAHNARTGVAVQEGQGPPDNASFNTITANQIKYNGNANPGYIGIDLTYDGVTTNDVGDGDVGPNRLVNFPANMTATYGPSGTIVSGTLDMLGMPATVEIFRAIPDSSGSNHGQGAVYLGSVSPAGATWTTAPVTLAAYPGQLLTATATDAFGNTSEFALNFPVTEQEHDDLDWGDAPDRPYPTKSASSGANHVIVAGMYLGNSIDGEPDGQPDATATGDDFDGYDDEDGVTFPIPLKPGQTGQIDILASVQGRIDAWIDFDGNGIWGGGAELILPNVFHPGGMTVPYTFAVPPTAVPGSTFARIRFSSAGSLSPTGGAQDGEVEDEMITIEEDNTASIGDFVWDDLDQDGIQDANEPGLGNVTVNLYDGGGTFLQTTATDGVGFYQFTAVPSGNYYVEFIPLSGYVFSPQDQGTDDTKDSDADPSTGQTIVFFLPGGSSDVTWDAGMSEQGEELDWGDAPDDPQNLNDYPTLQASNGASHLINPNVFLGAGVDPEPNGQPQVHALGDDNSIVYGGFDDEDGVIFTSPLVVGGVVTLDVIASVGGHLNAWVDFNRDGDWQHPAEQVFIDQALVPGVNSLSFVVPGGASAGTSYVRFRFTSAAGLNLSPRGQAPDGEVEDYIVEIEDGEIPHKMHWAQLPDPNGWDVQGCHPKILADDFRCTATGKITRITFWGSWRDDVVGQIENVHFSIHSDDRNGEYSKPGELLWEIDTAEKEIPVWFDDPEFGEQGWYDLDTGEGQRPDHDMYFKYTVDIPEEMAYRQEEGTIYWLDIQVDCFNGEWGWKTSRSAHFEDDAVWDDTPQNPADWKELIDPETGLSIDLAFIIDGEEEQIDLDFGDAPEQAQGFNYPTTLANNGARHVIAADATGNVYRMGLQIDPEPDGQPTVPADGDDINAVFPGIPGPPGDEDGVILPTTLIPNQNATVTVTVSAAGWLDAWIDYNGNGTWDHPAELAISQAVAGGANNLSFLVPGGAMPGPSYARFRFNGAGVALLPTGPAPSGEVEDHPVHIEENPVERDWGDAPDSVATPRYPTLSVNGGAYHLINPNVFLGNLIDAEPDGQPHPHAMGDDFMAGPSDDEDGVIPLTPFVKGSNAMIQVTASVAGTLFAWVDFNGDGIWQNPGEQLFGGPQPLSSGVNVLNFAVPSSALTGPTYVRYRFTTSTVALTPSGGGPAGGPDPDGEVEDYILQIEDGEVPHKMHWAQWPDPNGWDVGSEDGQDPHLLADDFRCTESGPIRKVVFWGSWFGDEVGVIENIHLSFHDDDRTGEYSKPFNPALWEWNALPGSITITEELPDDQGFYDPETGLALHPNHVRYFRYEVDLTDAPDVFEQEEGKIYWLDVRVETEFGNWGWKTSRAAHFEDDAVWWDPISGQWLELIDPRPEPEGGYSLDLAFYISDEEPDEDLDFGDAPEQAQGFNYPTTLANNGARHVVPPSGPVFYLGQNIDPEPDGQPSVGAQLDDTTGAPPNDEDGVMFPAPFIPGVSAVLQVLPQGPAAPQGYLNVWIDYDQSGNWDPGEQLFTNLPVTPGVINGIGFLFPAGATPGQTYMRVRFSSVTGLATTGQAPDGEVEDYLINVEDPVKVDWGDAPGPYPTVILSNGARHLIVPGMFLGNSVDGELNGQPDLNALGDDMNILFPGVAFPPGDEDGVTWYPMVPGKGTAIGVTASVAGVVDVWIDYNGDGMWGPAEKVLTAATVNGGGVTTTLPFTVPAGASSISTFARVRYSLAGVPLPTGQASEGEVEDYEVNILPEDAEVFDYGDAMDPSYPTFAASGGAFHVIGSGLFLGNFVEADPDGQPTLATDGDDVLDGTDDEDGVAFPAALIGGTPTVVQIIASMPGRVDMWIDLNGNGSWLDAGENVLLGVPVNPGPNYLSFTPPAGATTVMGSTVSRVRISTTGFLPPTGFAPDGEVEDHAVEVYEGGGLDFGDAPNLTISAATNFPTTLMDFGAAHLIDSLFMGQFIDAEQDGQPSVGALGDDTNALYPGPGSTPFPPGDEDGVTFNQIWVSGRTAQFTVVVNPALVGTYDLDLWVDWDGDGTWTQADNHVLNPAPVIAGPNPFTINIPAGIGPVNAHARFRLTHPGTGTGFGGFVKGGEVEDYMVPVGKTLNSIASLDRTTVPISLVLSWTTESGASSYNIYSSTNLQPVYPHPPNWTLEPTGTGLPGLSWSQNITVPVKFYSVIAFP